MHAMWGVARSLNLMGGRAESALGEASKKSEHALKAMKGVFRGADDSFNGWLLGVPSGAAEASLAEAPTSPLAPPASPSARFDRASWEVASGESAAAVVERVVEPCRVEVPAASRLETSDDAAMQRHFAALDRLVGMGLSPQAARVALRHLDAWLVDEAGALEMRAAEAAAQAAGQPVLHVGDRVRLEGLIRHVAANGKSGQLHAYRADDQRWKVLVDDGQVFMLQPKFLRPLEFSRATVPPLHSSAESASASPARTVAPELLAAWARLEDSQAAWKEQQEAREIKLLEREESLRKLQEELEEQQRLLGHQRRSLAMDHARALAELEQHAETPEPARRGSALFAMDGGSPNLSPKRLRVGECGGEAAEDEEDDSMDEASEGGEVALEEEDGVWDMDWAALLPTSSTANPGREERACPKDEVRLAEAERLELGCQLAAAAEVATMHEG